MSFAAIITGLGFPLALYVIKRRFDNDEEAWEKIIVKGLLAVAAGFAACWLVSSAPGSEEEEILYLGAIACSCAAGYAGIDCLTAISDQLEKESKPK